MKNFSQFFSGPLSGDSGIGYMLWSSDDQARYVVSEKRQMQFWFADKKNFWGI
jgi:hypothetical protein